MLMQHLVTEPAWLNRRLDVPRVGRPGPRRRRLAPLLRAPLLREAPLRDRVLPGGRPDDDAKRATPSCSATRSSSRSTRESYLDDIDGSFYVIGYLRSWAFEAQLRDFLRSEFGNEWFARREAGDLLRELWSLGQGPTADELLKDVTGANARDGLGRRPDPRGPLDLTVSLSAIVPSDCAPHARRDAMPPRRSPPRRGAARADARGDEPALAELYDRFGRVAVRARAARPARSGARAGRRPGRVPHRMAHGGVVRSRPRHRVDLAADARAPPRGRLVRREDRRRGRPLDDAPIASGDATDEEAAVREERRDVQAALAQLTDDRARGARARLLRRSLAVGDRRTARRPARHGEEPDVRRARALRDVLGDMTPSTTLFQLALDSLPPQLAAALENVAVVVEEEDPDDPELFGLWEADEFCRTRSRSSADL